MSRVIPVEVFPGLKNINLLALELVESCPVRTDDHSEIVSLPSALVKRRIIEVVLSLGTRRRVFEARRGEVLKGDLGARVEQFGAVLDGQGPRIHGSGRRRGGVRHSGAFGERSRAVIPQRAGRQRATEHRKKSAGCADSYPHVHNDVPSHVSGSPNLRESFARKPFRCGRAARRNSPDGASRRVNLGP